jgi:hypothetical protein
MNRSQLERYVGRWDLDECVEDCEYEWKLLGTLTFPGTPSWPKARRLFYRWVAEMRKDRAPQFLNWIAVFEHSRFDGSRIYVLIGASEINSRRRWTIRWQELSRGDATLDRYRRGGFPKYLLGEARPNQHFVVAMDFCGWGLYEAD